MSYLVLNSVNTDSLKESEEKTLNLLMEESGFKKIKSVEQGAESDKMESVRNKSMVLIWVQSQQQHQ